MNKLKELLAAAIEAEPMFYEFKDDDAKLAELAIDAIPSLQLLLSRYEKLVEAVEEIIAENPSCECFNWDKLKRLSKCQEE